MKSYFVFCQGIGIKNIKSGKPYWVRGEEELAETVLELQDSLNYERIIVEEYGTRKKLYDWSMDAEIVQSRRKEVEEIKRKEAELKAEIKRLQAEVKKLQDLYK